ncbi:MAG: hypothetical protein HY360_22645 [Verrucomicrobia bacterium]|nr:hypothetical protein [Verrucomicrobiota bacterium]
MALAARIMARLDVPFFHGCKLETLNPKRNPKRNPRPGLLLTREAHGGGAFRKMQFATHKGQAYIA